MNSIKKLLLAGFLGLIVIVSVIGSKIVLARDGNQSEQRQQSIRSTETAPVIITIGANGEVMLRGKITAVTGDSISVKSWGAPWTVKITTNTKIMSVGKVLSDFKIGDFIGVQGTMNETDFIISANVLRNWGVRPDHDNDGLSDNQDNDDDNDHQMDNQDQHNFDHNNDGQDDQGDEGFDD